MRVLVCGSRDWQRPAWIGARMAQLPKGSEILHGDARGADHDASMYAKALGFHARRFDADWKAEPRRAGIIRNLAMFDAQPDLVLAFWDGKSRGTAHVVAEAERRGIRLEVVTHPPLEPEV